jgi:hypothetical protein
MSSARRLLTAVLLGIAVAACNSESDTPRTPSATADPIQQALPSPTDTQAETQLLAATSTFLPSPTSASRPTRTPYPTPGPGDGTEEPPEDYVLPGDWLYAPFTDASGTERTLEEFLGRGIIVQITSASCGMCVEQHEFLLAAIQDRHDLNLLPDTVFIVMGINQQETPDLIRTVLQNELPDAWPTVERLDDPEVPADWLAAVASPDLIDALALAFGPHTRTVSELTTIVIQPDGLAFQFTGTLTHTNTLRDAISAYGNPPIR